MISVNHKIRKEIEKSGGDTVNVTLYLLTSKEQITEKEIIETFKDAEVLKAFENLSEDEKNNIISQIISLKSKENQLKTILTYIDQLIKHKI